MKTRFIFVAWTAVALLLSASLSFALENKADARQEVAAKANTNAKDAKSKIDAKRKAAAKIKLVDINNASSEELKKLPGISDTEANKIIAGRPYSTKAWLVTHNIIAIGVYENLKRQIVVGAPNKNGAKNAAIYEKKK